MYIYIYIYILLCARQHISLAIDPLFSEYQAEQQILSTLFQRCFVNVEWPLVNISRLNFHFQLNINVGTTFG